jgi:hypothetical protein
VADRPKVVILGKGKASGSKKMQQMLTQIELSEIPGNLLDSMFVTMSDSTKYKIEKKHIQNGVSYAHIDEHLEKIGITRDVNVIELVIDFDKAQKVLDAELANLLNPYFNDLDH